MITTHVLDTARGGPAAGIRVTLHRLVTDRADGWVAVGEGTTDADGRLRSLVAAGAPLEAGRYRLVFDTGAYHRSLGVVCFHPEVIVVFAIADPAQHYHVPLLLSPFGYTTYRGA